MWLGESVQDAVAQPRQDNICLIANAVWDYGCYDYGTRLQNIPLKLLGVPLVQEN